MARAAFLAQREAGVRGGPHGDLYVVIHIQDTKSSSARTIIFIRSADSVQRGRARWRSGRAHSPKASATQSPAGTQSGQLFKLRGRIMNVNGRERGDLLARLLVEVPTRLNSEQRQKIEEFAALCGEENSPYAKVSSNAPEILSDV